ncbi:4-hydroxyphenylpyruvate dioxygenase [Actinoallomurus acanthiterrae]
MQGFAFVELYVSDRVAMIAYFTRGFDLIVAAEADMSDRHSTLLRGNGLQLIITVPRGDASPVTEWLAEHGEGVADVAFYHREIALAAASALRIGLPVLTPTQPTGTGCYTVVMAGLGSVCHTLIDPVDATAPVAPPGRPWRWNAVGGRISRYLRAIDHIEFCTQPDTLQPTVDIYRQVLGFREGPREQIRVGQNRVNMCAIHDRAGAATCLFTEPAEQDNRSPAAEFLQSNHGPGVRYLAFSTSSIANAVRAFKTRGVAFQTTPSTYYDQLVYSMADRTEVMIRMRDLRGTGVLVAKDGNGTFYQAYARSPHPRRTTLNYQIVQREGGARGFGAANQVALWNATATDLAVMEEQFG